MGDTEQRISGMKNLARRFLYIAVISTVASLSANMTVSADDMTDTARRLLARISQTP